VAIYSVVHLKTTGSLENNTQNARPAPRSTRARRARVSLRVPAPTPRRNLICTLNKKEV